MNIVSTAAALVVGSALTLGVGAASAAGEADAATPAPAPVSARSVATASVPAVGAPQSLYDGYYITNDLTHPLFLIHDTKWTATANGWGDAPPERLDPGKTYYFSVEYWLGYNDDSAATWSDTGTTSGTWYTAKAYGNRVFADTRSTMLSLDLNARLITDLGPAYGQTKFYIEPKPTS